MANAPGWRAFSCPPGCRVCDISRGTAVSQAVKNSLFSKSQSAVCTVETQYPRYCTLRSDFPIYLHERPDHFEARDVAVITLRGDLARLSDRELAKRLDEALQACDAWPVARETGWAHWRGPIRHPRAYRVFYVLTVLSSVVELLSFSRGGDLPLGTMRTYLLVCEIQDLLDETRWRVDARRTSSSTGVTRRWDMTA
jgi:hypothetical protein